MLGDIQKKISNWLSQNRGLLWAVMSHKDSADALLRSIDVTPQELLNACDKLEDSLDGLKDMLKQLYLLLYEIEEELKKAALQVSAEKRPPPSVTVSRITGEGVAKGQPAPQASVPLQSVTQPNAVPQAVSQRVSAPLQEAPSAVSAAVIQQTKPSVAATKQPIPVVPNHTPPTFEVPVTAAGKQGSPDAAQIKCEILDDLEKEAKRSVDTKSIRIEKPSKPGGLIEYMG
ncbi:MAG: hypothetical protein N2234_04920, partial [Planctomycetota bacterium]|nr:hypothetical protein [Planctomycetota bacterium]